VGDISTMPVAVGAVIGGLAVLVLAADRVVVAAVRVSQAIGLSAVLIGALVVGLGTSIPELLVSTLAAVDGRLDVAMANVVGSNVTNVTLVLGSAALMAPLAARSVTIRREGLLMLVAIAVLAAVLLDGRVEAYEGGALAFGLLVALYLLIRWSLGDAAAEVAVEAELEEMIAGTQGSALRELAVGFVAIGLTVFAANLLLQGSLAIGRRMDLGDGFLGIMLGVGTSLPELATSIAAVRRREPDLVIGNVLGSNIFNSLAVAGVAGLVGAGALSDLTTTAVWVMVALCLAAGWFSHTGLRLVRVEGGVLVAAFLAFTVSSY
jgi:cation:H+ antiporter